MIYAVPFTQVPKLNDLPVEEVDPYINVSLSHYASDMPANPYNQLTTLRPHTMNFFRLTEAIQVFNPQFERGVGLGVGEEVLRSRNAEIGEEGDLLVSDLGLYETILRCRSLKKGGSLLLVIPNQTKLSEVQMSYLYASCFSMVQILLPSMSHTDADRVLYCADFLGNVPSWITIPPPYNFTMTSYFVTKLDEINSIFGQSRFDQLKCGARDRCAEWLRKFM